MKNHDNRHQFASDNYSGICPQAMQCLIKANEGHALPYGDDRWTKEACDLFRGLFETDCEVFFVYNGTAANAISLAAMCQSYHSIICHKVSHIETDECGATEFYSNGAKILLGEGRNGKLLPGSVRDIFTRRSDIHYPKPQVVSLTQSTEVGTVYTPDEINEISSAAGNLGLKLHMDGARFANAAVSLGLPAAEISWKCGTDVLCFGGTKNGMMGGEAIIFFDKDLAFEFAFRCKQSGQLASKMRFIAAQWTGLLRNDVWLSNARHANEMTLLLHDRLKEIDEVSFLFPVEANAIFVSLPEQAITGMHEKGWIFYSFIGDGGCRLMCGWDTSEEIIDKFIGDLKQTLSGN